MIARALRDAGWEVIYTGLRQSPEQIVQMALQEDVDLLGLSILSGGYEILCKKVLEALAAQRLDLPVIVGGVIPKEAQERLRKLGIAAIFGQEHTLEEMLAALEKIAREARSRREKK